MKRVWTLFFIICCLILGGCSWWGSKVPVAKFTLTQGYLGAGDLVMFNSIESNDDKDGKNLLARWDFEGDGVWEIDYPAGKMIYEKVYHAYFKPGIYNPILEVKNSQQKTARYTQKVTVIKEDVAVEGHVVESRGGVGIPEAQVKLFNQQAEIITTSQSDGSFSLTAPSGIYQLVITKEGFASSLVQDLYLGVELQPELDIPLLEAFYPGWATTSPAIIVDQIDQLVGQPVSDTVILNIHGDSLQGINSIEVNLGNQNYAPDFYYVSVDECQITLDTTLLPNGWNYLRIAMYDANHNFTQTFVPIYVSNNVSSLKVSKPRIGMLCSYTFGQSLNLMSLGEDNRLSKYLSELVIDLEEIRTVATKEYTIFNQIVWEEVANAKGYRVYRSFSEDSDYTLVAVANRPSYVDLSPLLIPDKAVYYKVSAFCEDYEGPMSDPAFTIPLDVFNVTLISPAQNATVFTDHPLFSWEYNELVGDTQSYELVVQGVTDEISSVTAMVTDETSYIYDGTPLLDGKAYEWDITSASAYREYSYNSFALSASGESTGSLNGVFRFYTDFE